MWRVRSIVEGVQYCGGYHQNLRRATTSNLVGALHTKVVSNHE